MLCCTTGSCCGQLGRHLRVGKGKPARPSAAAAPPHQGGAGPSWWCPPVRYHKHTPPGVPVQLLLRRARLAAPPGAREGVRASAEYCPHRHPQSSAALRQARFSWPVSQTGGLRFRGPTPPSRTRSRHHSRAPEPEPSEAAWEPRLLGKPTPQGHQHFHERASS